jgi:organic radical activating enzyme
MNQNLKFALKHMIPNSIWKKLGDFRARQIKSKAYFQVHLTYHCNLKCKSCSHFSAISEDNYLDIVTFENDLKKLSSLGKKNIRKIDLLGGEPLLHPGISDFLIIARKYFRTAEIILLTNGILLPKMPEIFWETCNKNNIIIAISWYPINIDLDTIRQNAKKYNVSIQYDAKAINSTFGHFKMDITGTQDEWENIRTCYESKNCHCLDKGKMFLCYIPACIDIFNKQFNTNIPICENDYIDIYKVKSMSEILRYFRKPMPFCKYCNVKDRYRTKWGISTKSIEEWT